MTTPGEPALRRRLGLFDTVTLGLGSMIGAGIFVALAPAAEKLTTSSTATTYASASMLASLVTTTTAVGPGVSCSSTGMPLTSITGMLEVTAGTPGSAATRVPLEAVSSTISRFSPAPSPATVTPVA